jgi:hypothetical protein
MKRQSAAALALLAFLQFGIHQVEAWDYEGHRVVNQLALASLPTNFPAFVREPAAVERTAFLAGEMDRWRNTPDLLLKHYSFPDHYIDMEELANYGLKPEVLPVFRHDFVAQLALIRKAHPEKFPEPEGGMQPGPHARAGGTAAVGDRGVGGQAEIGLFLSHGL